MDEENPRVVSPTDPALTINEALQKQMKDIELHLELKRKYEATRKSSPPSSSSSSSSSKPKEKEEDKIIKKLYHQHTWQLKDIGGLITEWVPFFESLKHYAITTGKKIDVTPSAQTSLMRRAIMLGSGVPMGEYKVVKVSNVHSSFSSSLRSEGGGGSSSSSASSLPVDWDDGYDSSGSTSQHDEDNNNNNSSSSNNNSNSRRVPPWLSNDVADLLATVEETKKEETPNDIEAQANRWKIVASKLKPKFTATPHECKTKYRLLMQNISDEEKAAVLARDNAKIAKLKPKTDKGVAPFTDVEDDILYSAVLNCRNQQQYLNIEVNIFIWKRFTKSSSLTKPLKARGLQALYSRFKQLFLYKRAISEGLQVIPSVVADALGAHEVNDKVLCLWTVEDAYHGDFYPAIILKRYASDVDKGGYLYDVKFESNSDKNYQQRIDACNILSEMEYKEYSVQRKRKGLVRCDYDNRHWTTELSGNHIFTSLVSAMRTYDELLVLRDGTRGTTRALNLPDDWEVRPHTIPVRNGGGEFVNRSVVEVGYPGGSVDYSKKRKKAIDEGEKEMEKEKRVEGGGEKKGRSKEETSTKGDLEDSEKRNHTTTEETRHRR